MRQDFGLLPEFMGDMAADEVGVLLLAMEHRGDLVAMYRAIKQQAQDGVDSPIAHLGINELTSICNRPRFAVARTALVEMLSDSFDETLKTLRGPFFKALSDSLQSSKDRTRIEAMRIAAGLFEKQASRDAKANEAALLGSTAKLEDLARKTEEMAKLTDEQLCAVITNLSTSLH